ncbi:MAG: alpha/beta hydrolase domain-containing protein [Hyphomicrobium sp.]
MAQRLGSRSALGLVCATLAVAAPGSISPAEARITRIVIDDVVSPAFCRAETCGRYGDIGAYEQIAGRAFGELDPTDPLNRLIQDIELVKEADGKVRYTTTFVISRPIDPSKSSGLLWHDVPNRGRPVVLSTHERGLGDIGLASAWQGDNAGMSPSLGTTNRQTMSVGANHWLQLPVARNADGSAITGRVFARIVNRSGPQSQPLIVQTNPVPYMPASLDPAAATLVSRDHETIDGKVTGERAIASGDWRFCGGGTFDNPAPLIKLPVQLCLKGGFDAAKLYQVVYTAKDPYPLGIGFAAWRDVASFFRHAKADDVGTANPLAGQVTHSIARGRSQSGNYLRGWLHLGFNQDEAKRRVHDGMWPVIAGRRIALNFRWAQPDGVLELYQAGSEGPQWWVPWPDKARGLPERSIQDRCMTTKTCPKIIEHFGAAELWALKLGPEWIGTDASADIPLPDNVRRYYLASTTHGGGTGGIPAHLPAYHKTARAVTCPGNNWGSGVLPANPLSHDEPWRAIAAHFRNWVMKDQAPPPSRFPTIREGHLVEPSKAAMGFPTLPGLRKSAPEADLINPLLDYDWGPGFDPNDASGVPSDALPSIRQTLPMRVPKVDADGNEIGGIPQVLLEAPLGTYLGWNLTADGPKPFHRGKLCNYAGGMIPFFPTKAEREAVGDPRPSLEERYGNHAGFVSAVRKAVQKVKAAGFLLESDAAALIAQAEASSVLK